MAEGTTNSLSVITESIGTVISVVGKIFDVIVGNPYLVFLMAAGMLGVAIGVFKKLKRAAR